MIETKEVFTEALHRCIDLGDCEKARKVLKAFEVFLNESKPQVLEVPLPDMQMKKPIDEAVLRAVEGVGYKPSPIKRTSSKLGAEYIKGWEGIRKAILRRDESRCRICNKDYNLHVHHIDYDRGNNKDSNLVTLCEPCHRAVHREGYKPWNDDYPAPWNKQEVDDYNQENYIYD